MSCPVGTETMISNGGGGKGLSWMIVIKFDFKSHGEEEGMTSSFWCDPIHCVKIKMGRGIYRLNNDALKWSLNLSKIWGLWSCNKFGRSWIIIPKATRGVWEWSSWEVCRFDSLENICCWNSESNLVRRFCGVWCGVGRIIESTNKILASIGNVTEFNP